MSKDFFWGLTARNIQDALWNTMSQNAMLVGGMAVAVVANVLARSIIPNNRRNQADKIKHLAGTVMGVAAGIRISFWYADRLPHVTFAADKALKFAVMSSLGGFTAGGALGYFGRSILRFNGAVGAVIGSLFVTGFALSGESSSTDL
jgi:hypothetical protein